MEVPVTKKTMAAIAAALLLCGGAFYFAEGEEEEPAALFPAEPGLAAGEKEEKPETDAVPAVMKVDVKGAVARPGVYTASEGDRVIDLIEEAGNFLKKADRNQVNLAQIIEDQMVIYVPVKGEEPAGAIGAAGAPGGAAEGGGSLVNLNTAGTDELQTLPGIGPAKAEAIIEYRETNGPFGKPEDLTKVSGIGEKTFEKFSSLITVK